MIQTTRWSPDTCKCVVEYTWDDSVPQDSRVHTIANVVVRCNLHQSITDKHAHFAALTDENPRKNKLIDHLVSNFPALATTDSDGNPRLKDGVITWAYDSSRVLNITIASLSASQKLNLQSALDAKFGIGKIVIA